MKCSKCGNPNAMLSLKLVIKTLQTGKKTIKEGCGICITAEILGGQKFAKLMNAPDAIIVEKMAEKLGKQSYEKFKHSMETKH